jgi:hypothetical protein
MGAQWDAATQNFWWTQVTAAYTRAWAKYLILILPEVVDFVSSAPVPFYRSGLWAELVTGEIDWVVKSSESIIFW